MNLADLHPKKTVVVSHDKLNAIFETERWQELEEKITRQPKESHTELYAELKEEITLLLKEVFIEDSYTVIFDFCMASGSLTLWQRDVVIETDTHRFKLGTLKVGKPASWTGTMRDAVIAYRTNEDALLNVPFSVTIKNVSEPLL